MQISPWHLSRYYWHQRNHRKHLCRLCFLLLQKQTVRCPSSLQQYEDVMGYGFPSNQVRETTVRPRGRYFESNSARTKFSNPTQPLGCGLEPAATRCDATCRRPAPRGCVRNKRSIASASCSEGAATGAQHHPHSHPAAGGRSSRRAA